MLASVGLLTEEERFAIADALDQVGVELNDGTFAFAPTDEDIHTAIERRVTEIAGPGRREAPHRAEPQRPGRARPAAVGAAGGAARSSARIHDLQSVLVRRAEECDDDAYLPGYTHLQRAQPVLLAHHLLAHLWALDP